MHIFLNESLICCSFVGFKLYKNPFKDEINVDELWDKVEFLVENMGKDFFVRNLIQNKEQMI